MLDEFFFGYFQAHLPENFLVLFPLSLASGDQPWLAFVAWVAEFSSWLSNGKRGKEAEREDRELLRYDRFLDEQVIEPIGHDYILLARKIV